MQLAGLFSNNISLTIFFNRKKNGKKIQSLDVVTRISNASKSYIVTVIFIVFFFQEILVETNHNLQVHFQTELFQYKRIQQ